MTPCVKKPPLLVFITTAPITLGSFFRGQFDYWKRKGFKVIAISSPGNELNDLQEKEGIETYAVPMVRGISPIQDIPALMRLYAIFKKLRPTIVHASTPKAGLLAMICATAAGVPIRIFTVRGLMSEMPSPVSPVLKWLEKITCGMAHAVTANSHSVAQKLIENKICGPGKIRVFGNGSSNGVDAEDLFNPGNISVPEVLKLRDELGIPASATVITFAGRIVKDKGIVELAQAWEQLKKNFHDPCLLIIGETEDGGGDIERTVSALRKDPNVIFTGWVPKANMPVYYSLTDVLVLPTYREGFPNVILEASAMEIPVVATRVTGCVDAVVDGVTGCLVAPKDPDALAVAIEMYIVDPQLRRQHGEAGRLRVLRDYRPELIWEALYEEYVRLMREKGIPFLPQGSGIDFSLCSK